MKTEYWVVGLIVAGLVLYYMSQPVIVSAGPYPFGWSGGHHGGGWGWGHGHGHGM
jgi:hypothetical protein